MTQKNSDLRARRKARLANDQAGAQPNPNAPNEQPKKDPAQAPAPAPQHEQKPADAPEKKEEQQEQHGDEHEALVAPVLDPAEVSRSASVSLQLFNEETSDPHWLVCANGQPVAQIRLSDQEDADRLAPMFVKDAYANGIIGAASQMDLSELLTSVRARSYVASVENSTAFKAIEARVKTAAAEETRKAKSNLRNDMVNALNLVVTAQSKNYLSENVLKHALFTRLAATGMEEDRAVSVIEAAFSEGASEYFDNLFKQAMKWMDLSPEAYAEISEEIQGMPQRTPVITAEADPKPSMNVPLMTYTAGWNEEEAADEKAALRERLGLGRRR